MTKQTFGPGPIEAGGAVFGEFRLTDHLPPHAAPATIDRDRLHMAAQCGFNRKVLPVWVDPANGEVWSGGRYLFDTHEDARAYAEWVQTRFELDGIPFWDRPDFDSPSMLYWRVLGAEDFKDIHDSHHVCRTEIWDLADPDDTDWLDGAWSALRDAAANRGHSSLWLLHDESQGRISLLTTAERQPGDGPPGPDYRSIEALRSLPSLGEAWERDGRVSKHLDRTHWVFTIWFPRIGGKDVEPALWPNSPPLPGLS